MRLCRPHVLPCARVAHMQRAALTGSARAPQLLSDMIADPAVKNRVMIDVMNEPDARGLRYGGPQALECGGFQGVRDPEEALQTPCLQRVHACDTT
jgi:hypothetical protein